MKKIKWYLAVIVMLAVGSAFTNAKPKTTDTVYYHNGFGFFVKDPDAGTCESSETEFCTYTYNGTNPGNPSDPSQSAGDYDAEMDVPGIWVQP